MSNRFTDKVRAVAGGSARSQVSISSLLEESGSDAILGREPDGRYVELPAERFVPDPTQPRRFFDQAELDTFREGLEKNGQIQPIVVYPGEGELYNIIAGERRWRAISESSKINNIKAIIAEGPVDDEQRLLLQISENKDREDITLYEEAHAVLRFVELGEAKGRTKTECAERLRISGGLLSKYVAIASAEGPVATLAQSRENTDVEALYTLAKASNNDPLAVGELIDQFRAGELDSGLREASRRLLDTQSSDSQAAKKRSGKTKRASNAKGSKVAKVSGVSVSQDGTGETYILKVALSERRSVRYRLDAEALARLKADVMNHWNGE